MSAIPSKAEESTRCVPAPERLLVACRVPDLKVVEGLREGREPSGVQPLARPRRASDLVAFGASITPDIDALGYDPFDDQPTLVADRLPVESPLLLVQRKDAWLDTLPEAARAVLLEATVSIPADAPRLAGAIARQS